MLICSRSISILNILICLIFTSCALKIKLTSFVICRGLDETHFRRLYLRQNVIMMKKKELERSTKDKKEDSVLVTEAHEYDLNNENDMSYCPNSQVLNGDGDNIPIRGTF